MPRVYLDAATVIYSVEDPPLWGSIALARIAALRSSGAGLVVSDLVRLECRVKPLATGSVALLSEYEAFFASGALTCVPLTRDVCDHAATIRAQYRFRTVDALHLAAALESGCDVFLTNDAHLTGFPELTVELLR
jgi:predicted nucleic acid-binding protein